MTTLDTIESRVDEPQDVFESVNAAADEAIRDLVRPNRGITEDESS